MPLDAKEWKSLCQQAGLTADQEDRLLSYLCDVAGVQGREAEALRKRALYRADYAVIAASMGTSQQSVRSQVCQAWARIANHPWQWDDVERSGITLEEGEEEGPSPEWEDAVALFEMITGPALEPPLPPAFDELDRWTGLRRPLLTVGMLLGLACYLRGLLRQDEG
jgi:hypothetical protein